MEWLIRLLHDLYNVRGLIEWGGLALVCAVIFMETGLFAGFFLPGDSLLVTAGIFAASGHLKLVWLLTLVTLCAIAGDQLGYLIGLRAGASLYSRRDSRFFKKKHVERAHEFYEKYGGKNVILARFIPIVRTFCPPVAGAARMRYARYFGYDVVGGFVWVWSMVLAGFTLGSAIPDVESKLHYVIAGVIVLSFLPILYHAVKIRLEKSKPAPAPRPAKEERADCES
jgi:membrane-associated protein